MEVALILYYFIFIYTTVAIPRNWNSDQNIQLSSPDSHVSLTYSRKSDTEVSSHRYKNSKYVIKRDKKSNDTHSPEAQQSIQSIGRKPVTELNKTGDKIIQHNWKQALVTNIVENNLDRVVNFIAGEPNKYVFNSTSGDLDAVKKKIESGNKLDANLSRDDVTGTLSSLGQSSEFTNSNKYNNNDNNINNVSNTVTREDGESEIGTISASTYQPPDQLAQLPPPRITIFHVLETVLYYLINNLVAYNDNYYANLISNRISYPVDSSTSFNWQQLFQGSVSSANIVEDVVSPARETYVDPSSNSLSSSDATPEYRVQYISFEQPSLYEIFQGLTSIFSTVIFSLHLFG